MTEKIHTLVLHDNGGGWEGRYELLFWRGGFRAHTTVHKRSWGGWDFHGLSIKDKPTKRKGVLTWRGGGFIQGSAERLEDVPVKVEEELERRGEYF